MLSSKAMVATERTTMAFSETPVCTDRVKQASLATALRELSELNGRMSCPSPPAWWRRLLPSCLGPCVGKSLSKGLLCRIAEGS